MITAKEKMALNFYITRIRKEYSEFTGISQLPKMNIVPIEISLNNANQRGYGSFAEVTYDPHKDEYQLRAWKDIYKPQLHADYLLFHEFTHVADIEKYAKADKVKYASIKGYIEYHAAQIELMKQLGAVRYDEELSFSMEDVIKGIADDMPVIDVLRVGKASAEGVINRDDFPIDVEALVVTIGMVFNHLGRISICQRYAADYVNYRDELEDFSIEERLFGTDSWKIIRGIYHDEMSTDAIELAISLHMEIILSLIKKYGLL